MRKLANVLAMLGVLSLVVVGVAGSEEAVDERAKDHAQRGMEWKEEGDSDEALTINPHFSQARGRLETARLEAVQCAKESKGERKRFGGIGVGVGHSIPLKAMADNYRGGVAASIRLGLVQYPVDSSADTTGTGWLDAGFSESYISFFQSGAELKSDIVARYALEDPDALIRGVRFGKRGAPLALSFPKGSSKPAVLLAAPIGVQGVGIYRFRFADRETFSMLGDTTLTELRKEHNDTNLGSFSEFGLHALLLNHVALDANVRLESIDRVVMFWHALISAALTTIPVEGVDGLIGRLPEGWRWLYLYRIPVAVALYNLQYTHPNWPFNDSKPLHFVTYEFSLQKRF